MLRDQRSRVIFADLFSSGKKKKVVKAARQIRPKGLKFFKDFSTRTLQRRKERIPDLIKARKQGKKAFLVRERVIEYEDSDAVLLALCLIRNFIFFLSEQENRNLAIITLIIVLFTDFILCLIIAET